MKELLLEAYEMLRECRSELEAYEVYETGEDYNKPILNDLIKRLADILKVES